MKRNTDDIDVSILLCLSTLAAPFGVFVAVMYWLLQPTILPNFGVMMVNGRPKPTVEWSMELADRQRMEQGALEEARQANDAVWLTAVAKSEPREVVAQKEPKRKQTETVSRRQPSREVKNTPEPPQQFGSLLRRLFSF
jgi:hypothetical protein